MLESIKPEKKKQVAKTLEWLCFSLRPLLLDEVAEAFILDPDTEVPFDEENRLMTAGAVLGLLRGLITEIPRQIKKNNYDHHARWETDVIEIRLAHFSIKEYLVSDRMPSNISTTFTIKETDAHIHITESCLAYHLHLSKTTLATKELVRQYQLWGYVVKYWSEHLDLIPSDKCTPSTTERASQIFTRGSQPLLNMARIRSEGGRPDWETAVDELPPPLYHACFIGVLRLTELVLEAANASVIDEISTKSKYGFALQVAAFHGREAIVQLLLDKGADVNAQGGRFGNALQAASHRGYVAIVQLLLDKGAEMNAQGGSFGNALQAAAWCGDEAIVQLLLDKGADVNAKGGRYGNALQAAVYRRRWEIGELLLLRGAKVDPPGQEWEELLASVEEGWPKGANRLRKFQENPTVEGLGQIRKEEDEMWERRETEREERRKDEERRMAEAQAQELLGVA